MNGPDQEIAHPWVRKDKARHHATRLLNLPHQHSVLQKVARSPAAWSAVRHRSSITIRLDCNLQAAKQAPEPGMLASSLPILAAFLLLLPISAFAIPSIAISPNVLNESGQSVQIRWSGIDSPSELDWLGIYSPPNSSHKDFIGYVFLSSCDTWRSGSGAVQLPLVNLRSGYEFRAFRWTEDEVNPKHLDHDHNPLPGTKHLLARSEELRFEVSAPEQIHLSFTSTEEEMRVMFVTGDGEERFVNYGEEEGRMEHTVRAEVGRYEREDMCDAPANDSVGWRDPGYIHDAVMTNLEKGKRYYYRVR